MRLIPVHCDHCSRSALVEASAIVAGSTRCSECQGPARPLPGESYGPDDARLFKHLETTLREARLTAVNAAQLAVELEGRHAHPGRGLERLAELLPSLSVLELLVGSDAASKRKAEGILATLLEAMSAAVGSASGVVPAFGAFRGSKLGDGPR